MESSPPEPEARFVCGTCPSIKPASWCRGCAREKGSRETPNHFVDGRLVGPADIILVAEAPIVPRIIAVDRLHIPFADDAGVLISRAVEAVQKENDAFKSITLKKTYAVLCTGQDPNIDTINRCKTFLHNSFLHSNKDKPPTIVAMGMSAVKALGIKAKSLKEIQSRILPGVEIGGKLYNVVVTLSTKQLVAMPGIYNTFYNDLRRAFEITSQQEVQQVPIDELTKEYVIPKTVAEVRDICEHILNYSENGRPPESWSIAVDTETNTKFPHRASLKVLCVSFAWATGRACAIPLWHAETPYDPQQVVTYVQTVLESQKPKAFHNAKFDLKVFRRLGWPVNNFVWDTMLAEHALEEDKKGQYGLKGITRVFYPEFSGYADTLHEMQEKSEGASQLDNLRKHAINENEEAPKKLTRKQKELLSGGFEKIELDTLLKYAAIDTDMTRRISLKQLQRIDAEQQALNDRKIIESKKSLRQYPIPHLCKLPRPVKSVIAHTALPATHVLSRMEYDGIRVDRVYLDKLRNDLTTVIDKAQQELLVMSGNPELKLNAGAQIAKVLFSEGFIHPETGQRTFYPPVSKTPTGQFQTTEKVMKFLVAKYACPFSAKKLVYAKAFKAKNTFCQNVWDLSSGDGHLHTNYNIHGTATGRLSSNDENMQNIPKELGGFSIKKVFVPSDESTIFVNADAKGAEVRIFAAYSGDAELVRSLNDGMDTHSFFGSRIVEAVRAEPGAAKVLESMGLDDTYPLTYDDFAARDEIKQTQPIYGKMLDKFRTAVKRVVFGILYGAGPQKIAETIGISTEQAKSIINMLFRMFPSIPRYIEQTKWELRTFGMVETYFGRRRRFSVKGAPRYLLSKAERQTVNFKIQSTSSDIVMGRLVDIDEPLRRDMNGRLLLTVHDSIGFELPKKYLSQLPDFITHYLEAKTKEKCPWLPVDFKWDYEVGDSYGELSPLTAYLAKNPIYKQMTEVEAAYTEEEIKTELSEEPVAA